MNALKNSWSRLPAFLREALSLLAAMGVLFGLYRLLRIPIEDGLRKADFDSGFFLGSALGRSLSDPYFWLGAAFAVGIAWCSRGVKRWKALAPGTGIEWMAWVIIGIGTWTAALYPFNFLFGQGHLLDRFIILALGIAAMWRPAVLPFFLVAMLISYQQWKLPVGDTELTNRKPFIDLLIVMNACLLVSAWKRFPRRAFFFTLVSVVFIHYWIPGLAKFDVEGEKSWTWLTANQPLNMMITGTMLGWTVFWDETGAIQLWHAMEWMALPMKLFVLLVECGLLISFWNRKTLLAFTAGRLLLHIGILIFSGDTFWNWQLLAIGMLVAFWPRRKRPDDALPEESLFGWVPMIVTAIFVMLTANSWKASPLGWYDSRLVDRYDLEAITESGERRLMDPYYFAPYDFTFIQTMYHYLPEAPAVLTRTYGAVHDVETATVMRAAETPGDVRMIVEKYGETHHSKKRADGLVNTIQRWTENRQRIGETGLVKFLHLVSPPPHAFSFPAESNPYDPETDGPIREYEIVFERTWFDGEAFVTFDRQPLRRIPIEGPPADEGSE